MRRPAFPLRLLAALLVALALTGALAAPALAYTNSFAIGNTLFGVNASWEGSGATAYIGAEIVRAHTSTSEWREAVSVQWLDPFLGNQWVTIGSNECDQTASACAAFGNIQDYDTFQPDYRVTFVNEYTDAWSPNPAQCYSGCIDAGVATFGSTTATKIYAFQPYDIYAA